MNDRDPSRTPPARFSSAGLDKLILGFHPTLDYEALRKAAAAHKNSKIVAALSAQGDMEERLFLRFAASSLSLSIVDPLDPAVLSTKDAAAILGALPKDFGMMHRCVPLSQTDDEIAVAFADPLDMEAVSELGTLLQKRIRVCIAAESEIMEALVRVGRELSEISNIEIVTEDERWADSDESKARAAPVIQLVNTILSDALRTETSDIHFEPSEDGFDVRFRIDGVLIPKHEVPKAIQPHVTSRIKLLAGMDITERRRPQDGRMSLRSGDSKKVDVRVSTVPTPEGEKLVLRVLSTNVMRTRLESLGLPPAILRRLEELLLSTDGIILATGPTGSGKTTSLYACLGRVKTGERHIITVEDPIEFRLPGVTQIQVNKKVNMTFASGLRSILRQDPDVILVGEIRDLETAETAFHAAQTGHLVLSTLHTIDAPSAVTRLRDLGLESFLIASSLRAVLAQRLVRTLCAACARPLSPEETAHAEEAFGVDTSRMKLPVGCSECSGLGYRGRAGIYSLLPIMGAARDAVRDDGSESTIAQAARAFGYTTLFESGCLYVEQGMTTIAELERVLGSIPSFVPQPARETAAVKTAPPEPEQSISRSPFHIDFTPPGGAADGKAAAAAAQGQPHHPDSLLALAEQEQLHSSAAQPCVLVVDDNVKIRRVMAKALRDKSYDVIEAANGGEALKLLTAITPALVICDLEMPELNGKQFLASLRQNGEQQIPVLMLTDVDSAETQIDLLESGASDTVGKNTSLKLIVSRVQRLLQLTQRGAGTTQG